MDMPAPLPRDEVMQHNMPDCLNNNIFITRKCALEYLLVNDLVSGMCFKIPQERKKWAGRGWSRGDEVGKSVAGHVETR